MIKYSVILYPRFEGNYSITHGYVIDRDIKSDCYEKFRDSMYLVIRLIFYYLENFNFYFHSYNRHLISNSRMDVKNQ